MKTTQKFLIEVTGYDAPVKFRNLLFALQLLGSWGSSRTIQFDWDGDGADKLKVLDSIVEPIATKENLNDSCNYPIIKINSDGFSGKK